MSAAEKKKSGGKGRTTVLAALLAVVALLAAYLNDCLPGLGVGPGADAPGESDPAEPAESEPEPAESEPEPEPESEPAGPLRATVTVDLRGCSVKIGEGEASGPVDCAKLCEAEAPFGDAAELTIDAKQGPHDAVTAALDCAKSKGITQLAIQRE